MYEWWVFVHVLGVFGFLASHGVSMGVLVKLRSERDPVRVDELLQLSGRSTGLFYGFLLMLLVGGVVAGFMGDWWGYGWIWGGVVTLLIVVMVMYAIASPYYKRVRTITQALVGGSEAVSSEEYDQVLRSRRPMAVMVVGVVGLVAILYFMMFKPSLGLSPEPEGPAPASADVTIAAEGLAFTTDTLTVPADSDFSMAFDNREAVPHNVSIYGDESASDALFTGETITGPRTVTYEVPALEAGEYFFRCDVHPTQMTGTVEAG
jgi:plastocyanin